MSRYWVVILLLLASHQMAAAQDDVEPPSEKAAVSPGNIVMVPAEDENMTRYRYIDQEGTEAEQAYTERDTYRSENLQGNFIAQWLFIRQNGKVIRFWGARIIRLDPSSPLRSIGLRPGDVITRLDGIPVWRGMSRIGQDPWQLIQLEEHFGLTEVRFINQGSQVIRVGQINLDSFPNDPRPLPP
ncbi:MAG: hypothetical protein ACOYK7_03755 [Pirellulales bacterium]